MVTRAEEKELLTMDSTIHDKDRRAAWRHFLNIEAYYDALQTELVRQKNFLLFPDFDKEKSLDEPGRVKDLDRVHMMDESKLKVEQLKQAGKDSKKIVPYRRGAKARKIANAAGPPPPRGFSAMAIILTACIVAGKRADK